MRLGSEAAVLPWLLLLRVAAAVADQRTLATVLVEGGQYFSYQFGANVLQPQQAETQLQYSLLSSDGGQLPAWAEFTGANRTLSGTPAPGQDLAFNWTLAAASGGRQVAAATFLLVSAVRCPTGRYRHFRIRLSPANNADWYDTHGSVQGSSALCTVAWAVGSPAASTTFPSTLAPVNVSGAAQQPGNASVAAAPQQAFQQLFPAACDYSHAWLVRAWKCFHALDLSHL